ncbi:hypothetical protein IWW57_005463, partial [Coemansia sp. S610]
NSEHCFCAAPHCHVANLEERTQAQALAALAALAVIAENSARILDDSASPGNPAPTPEGENSGTVPTEMAPIPPLSQEPLPVSGFAPDSEITALELPAAGIVVHNAADDAAPPHAEAMEMSDGNASPAEDMQDSDDDCDDASFTEETTIDDCGSRHITIVPTKKTRSKAPPKNGGVQKSAKAVKDLFAVVGSGRGTRSAAKKSALAAGISATGGAPSATNSADAGRADGAGRTNNYNAVNRGLACPAAANHGISSAPPIAPRQAPQTQTPPQPFISSFSPPHATPATRAPNATARPAHAPPATTNTPPPPTAASSAANAVTANAPSTPTAPAASQRSRNSAVIPTARPTKPIPGLNIISQNLRGTGRGGKTTAGRNAASATPTDGENRFRESSSRTKKLAGLLSRLRRSDKMNAPEAVDIAFMQEFNTMVSPTTLLEARYREYQTCTATPGGSNDMARTEVSAGASHQRRTAAALFDTAILVHRRLGEAQLETSVSCPRATFVTVPERGLLLVSIHGPFKRVNEFHDDIVAAIERYQNNGWTPIIGGDFNIAPFPGDRATDAVNAEETAHWDIIPNYEQILNVRDYAHYAAPPPPPLSEPYSFTNPRSNL